MPKLFEHNDHTAMKRVFDALKILASKAFTNRTALYQAAKALSGSVPPNLAYSGMYDLRTCAQYMDVDIEAMPCKGLDYNGNDVLEEIYNIKGDAWSLTAMVQTESSGKGPWIPIGVLVTNWNGPSATDVITALEALAGAPLVFGNC